MAIEKLINRLRKKPEDEKSIILDSIISTFNFLEHLAIGKLVERGRHRNLEIYVTVWLLIQIIAVVTVAFVSPGEYAQRVLIAFFAYRAF